MPRLAPSLAVRAGVIFISIYLLIFFSGIGLLHAVSLESDETNQIGPDVAIAFASAELRQGEGQKLHLLPSGRFHRLAASNPSLWLLGDQKGKPLSFGPVPAQARALFENNKAHLQLGELQVPGVARPLSDMSVELRDTSAGSVLLAAGGVDPASISLATSFRYFITEGLFVILVSLVAAGMVAMLLAVPLVSAAVRPLTAAAAAIDPERPTQRVEETNAPRELLPLVRAYNAALDRVANELLRRKRFIADMAHELRTPLAVVGLRVEALKDTSAKADLHRVVARLSGLVAQMLDVERLSLARSERQATDLINLARGVVADMAPMAIAAGYDLSFVAPSKPVTVMGDHLALSRAIANLIGNAVAHGGGHGQIRVVVSEWGLLDVGDDGPGVAQAIRQSLFEPFCRERWDRDGCGLGLHLVREIMRSHGGDAYLLESTVGAAFRLEFPENGVVEARPGSP